MSQVGIIHFTVLINGWFCFFYKCNRMLKFRAKTGVRDTG